MFRNLLRGIFVTDMSFFMNICAKPFVRLDVMVNCTRSERLHNPVSVL